MYEIAGNGRVNPLGYPPTRLPIGPPHNPWTRLLVVALVAGVGFLLLYLLRPAALGGVLAASPFWAGAVALLVMSVRQIPAWHRARRMVRAYLEDHAGAFPLELRWYR